MITNADAADWAARFGVALPQIMRDHFISHVLAALGPETRFFGGTALCRTHLEGSRLSEDIDLLSPDPARLLAELARELPSALRREFPDTAWTPLLPEGDGLAGSLLPPGMSAIKVYVGRDGSNTRAWEFVPTEVHLRYRDLPETQTLQCPTIATFAAMKLAAWIDRHTPRDLFDLAGLASLGVLTEPGVDHVFRAKVGMGVPKSEFQRVPRVTVNAWETELAAQVGALPGAEHCLEVVRRALGG